MTYYLYLSNSDTFEWDIVEFASLDAAIKEYNNARKSESYMDILLLKGTVIKDYHSDDSEE
jgi:hypothetical protein